MQIKSKLFLLAMMSPAAMALPAEVVERQTGCNAVQVFIARGSNEGYPGRQSSIVNAVCSGVTTTCGYTDIGYPATFDNYCSSVEVGRTNGTSLITAFASRCPNSKIVLTGYSQGAHVVGDILGGGGGTMSGGCTQPSSSGLSPTTSPGNKIAAVALWGDVRHVASQSYNVGSGASRSGIFPRTSSLLTSLNRYSGILRSWCNSGDPVCANGSNSNDHLTYFSLYSTEAGTWIRSKL